MTDPPKRAYVLIDHALTAVTKREISLAKLEAVINSPGQIVPEQKGRRAYQSLITGPDGKERVFRAIVEEGEPLTVVTIYISSRIKKYWRSS